MSDELIELVRQYKVLYDTKAKDYKDQGVRNAVWEEIATTLNKAGKCLFINLSITYISPYTIHLPWYLTLWTHKIIIIFFSYVHSFLCWISR